MILKIDDLSLFNSNKQHKLEQCIWGNALFLQTEMGGKNGQNVIINFKSSNSIIFFFSFFKNKKALCKVICCKPYEKYCIDLSNILHEQLVKYSKGTIFLTSKQINLGWTTHYQTKSPVNFVSCVPNLISSHNILFTYFVLGFTDILHLSTARPSRGYTWDEKNLKESLN